MDTQNEQADNTELRLAAIFKSSNNNRNLSFDTAVLIEYEKETGRFKVLNGDFENSNEKAFNRITGEADFIYGNSNQMEVIDCDSPYSIYIFDGEFLQNIQESKEIDLINAVVYVATKASKVIIRPKDSVLLPNESYVSVKNPDSDEYDAMDIVQVLYESLDEKNEQEEEEQEEDSISVKDLIDEISNKIVGQEDAIKTLVTSICLNQVLTNNLLENENYESTELNNRKISILLDGETGTGKTAILKEIFEKLSIPMEMVKANTFLDSGYVSTAITNILSNLLIQANGDSDSAQRGIVVFEDMNELLSYALFDDIDARKAAQEEILSFISGGTYNVIIDEIGTSIPFNTNYLTFIFNGAFTSVKEKKIQDLGKNIIGFSGTETMKNKTYEVTAKDYIDCGLSRKFFETINVIANTKSYSVEDLKNILKFSEISPLRNFQKNAAMFGYENILFSDELVERLAKEAYDMKTGARGLQTLMIEVQREYLPDFILGNFEKDEPVKLDEEILDTTKKQRVRTI